MHTRFFVQQNNGYESLVVSKHLPAHRFRENDLITLPGETVTRRVLRVVNNLGANTVDLTLTGDLPARQESKTCGLLDVISSLFNLTKEALLFF